MRCRALLVLALIAWVAMVAVPAASQTQAAAPTPLRVISFEGGWNLPIWVAQRQGFFEAQRLAVTLTYTPNSGALVVALFDGGADLAFAGVDNLIAYQEGQGEVKLPVDPDMFAFMGGDPGFLSVVGGSGITSIAALKGKTASVDAMTTGFAFVLRELVARNGLSESDVTFVRAGGTANRYRELVAGKHDATLLRTPFELLAADRGLRVLASAETLGPYQGTVGIARRGWAREHEDALIGFIKAYKQAIDWVFDRANRDIAEALLVANIRDMTPGLAKPSYDRLLADKNALSRDLRPDLEGIRTVLALRSKYGQPQKSLTDPAKYVDTRYLDRASAR